MVVITLVLGKKEKELLLSLVRLLMDLMTNIFSLLLEDMMDPTDKVEALALDGYQLVL